MLAVTLEDELLLEELDNDELEDDKLEEEELLDELELELLDELELLLELDELDGGGQELSPTTPKGEGWLVQVLREMQLC